MDLMQFHLSIKDVVIIGGFFIGLGGAVNGIILAIIRSKFVPRSFLFKTNNGGTAIYRTVTECDKLGKKRETDRKEMGKRIEQSVKDHVDLMMTSNKNFLKAIEHLFENQNKQIADAIKGVDPPTA